jgi:hypothetical protein
MTNTVIYIIDFIGIVALAGWVAYGIRSDILWYDKRQKEKESTINEKR